MCRKPLGIFLTEALSLWSHQKGSCFRPFSAKCLNGPDERFGFHNHPYTTTVGNIICYPVFIGTVIP